MNFTAYSDSQTSLSYQLRNIYPRPYERRYDEQPANFSIPCSSDYWIFTDKWVHKAGVHEHNTGDNTNSTNSLRDCTCNTIPDNTSLFYPNPGSDLQISDPDTHPNPGSDLQTSDPDTHLYPISLLNSPSFFIHGKYVLTIFSSLYSGAQIICHPSKLE